MLCFVANVKKEMPFLHSYIFERGFKPEPVIQHAGFPSEVDSGESENAPGCQEQSGLPATAGVSSLVFTRGTELLLNWKVMY